MSATTPTTVFHGIFGARIQSVLQPLADRILARPEPPRHLFVDHDDRRRSGGEVAVLQQSAAEQRDAHRLEVAGNNLVLGQRRSGIIGPPRRLALERNPVIRLPVDEEVADRARSHDARQRANPCASPR